MYCATARVSSADLGLPQARKASRCWPFESFGRSTSAFHKILLNYGDLAKMCVHSTRRAVKYNTPRIMNTHSYDTTIQYGTGKSKAYILHGVCILRTAEVPAQQHLFEPV